MRIHHLNCATMCPASARLFNGEGGLLAPATMVCHCLLVETEAGLVLVDTGLGTDDVADPGRRLGSGFTFVTRPRLDADETAARQVVRLGFSVDDVRHVVVTHLDLDHAGGIPDFPRAKVHVHAPEHTAAMERRTLPERERYRPCHWAHGPEWVLHAVEGDRWLDFEAVRALPGVPPEVLLIPLIGHTRGHAGVAVQTDGGWLLHAGDAYFSHHELDPERPWCPSGLALFQRIVAIDDGKRRANQDRLRELAKGHPEVRVFSAHDPVELEAAQRAGDARGAARAA
jgi:glyoxylase-like metal-dependent hydrolase (beta-lactamase superfamily II)